MPALRDGAGTAGGDRRGPTQSRTHRYDPAHVDRAGARGAGRRAGDGRARGPPPRRPRQALGLDPVWLRHPSRALGRTAVFPARLGLGREPQPQHVQPDRARHRRRVPLQRDRDFGAGLVPCRIPRHGQHGRGLFRGLVGHYRAGIARPGAGTACPRPNRRGDPRVAEPRAENRAPRERRSRGRRNSAGRRASRRSAADSSGRRRAGGRTGARGRQRRR